MLAVVGWSMKPTLGKELAFDALIMAVWRRKPKTRVIVPSDQGSPVQLLRLAQLFEGEQFNCLHESSRQLS